MSQKSNTATPYRIWKADCPICGETCDLEEGNDWIFCDTCEMDYDVDVIVIRKTERLEKEALEDNK